MHNIQSVLKWTSISRLAYKKVQPSKTSGVHCESEVQYSSSSSSSSETFTSTKQQESSQSSVTNHIAFRVVEGVAHGGFGVVVKVQEVLSNFDPHAFISPSPMLAMKVIPKKGNAHNLEKLLREVQILRVLQEHSQYGSSSFIQQIHGDAYESPANVFIISEFLDGGDVFYYLKNGYRFTELQAKIILAELFLGLAHIHSKGYLHCDIKAENVMFDRKGHVKIIDFGLACKLDEVEQLSQNGGQMYLRPAGSLPYMAPELLDDCSGGRHTDWWAYGVLAFELFTGCSPWFMMGDRHLLSIEICTRNVNLPTLHFSRAAQHFIELLLNRNFQLRLGTEDDADILKAEFFKNVNWRKTAQLKKPPAFIPDKVCTQLEDRTFSLAAFKNLVFPVSRYETTTLRASVGMTRLAMLPSPPIVGANLLGGHMLPMTVYDNHEDGYTYCVSYV